jgi:general transcription factor 3C polypeptide 5 (transcription factor C subunit 1)
MQRPGQILQVVTQTDVDECFNAPMSEFRQLEMKYRPLERSSIPVRGSRVASQKVLVKVVKKRKRARGGEAVDGGVFTANIVGSIPQTVRFRCMLTCCWVVLTMTIAMADYQYTPRQDGHVAQLVQSLMDLDCGCKRCRPGMF